MPKPFVARVIVAGLGTLAVGTLGCGDGPSSPSQTPEALAVTSVSPAVGAAETPTTVFINGTGFLAGATVTLGGAATSVAVLSSRSLSASTPIRADGTVDLVVTNPDGQSATLPGAFTYATLAVTQVSPATGIIGRWLRVSGVGFLVGASATLDGRGARVIFESSSSLYALAPPHEAGAVDVVVTNPNARSATLSRGFTYQIVTLTASPDSVTAGKPLAVTWVAPPGQSSADWIGLYKVGDANTSPLWYEYTNGTTSGTLRRGAPAQPGQYEFRYLVDDGYDDAARSNPVTVIRDPR